MKVAILGGGVGAMTAAYWLTNPLSMGGPPEPMEVTVYQLGWRLGGKGASGRNLQIANRIEEHGLHIWLGFYANAFRMIRHVYDELQRPEGAPLRTWKDAFKPQNVITLMEPGPDNSWLPPWMFVTPPRPGEPGDQTSFPTPCGYLGTIAAMIDDAVQEVLAGDTHAYCPPHPSSPRATAALGDVHATLERAKAAAPPPHQAGQGSPDCTFDPIVLEAELVAAQLAVHEGLNVTTDCLGAQRVLLIADIGLATALGILRDLLDAPWTSIDDQEWREWLRKNGMTDQNYNGSLTRAMYDLVFGYPGGVASPDNMSLAAGTTACTTLRFTLDYYDAIFMKMQGGMGDTIFAPIYEALQRRGVQFRFLHRLREVIPSDGSIGALRIGVQATTWGQPYEPLFDVNGLPSWPATPFFAQLRQGAELREKHIDLEDYNADWPDVEELVLEKGKDFDLVVFGLSVGAVPIVCPQLVAGNAAWKAMVENVQTVQTQAFQIWQQQNIANLGWPPALDGQCQGQRAVLGAFVEPLDTWADMSQLIPREQWVVPMNNISYFCGVLPDGQSLDDVVQNARGYLDNDIATLMPGFRYGQLCVNVPGGTFTDEQRFAAQFFRANTQPTERYVLSVAGSTKYRIDPANTGYDNLVLAGDWVQNNFAIGCVESAVLGGMKGVQPYCPTMKIVE
jgi:uncharacterized protein with NAD-binding domain and iron-sulfur cluster